MRHTTYYCGVSADGYIADSDGGLEWLFESAGDAAPERETSGFDEFLAGIGALCMGSATYEFILGHESDWAYGTRPTWVFTHRDLPPIEGADLRFVQGSPADHHEEMIEAAGDRALWLVGGGDLASQFVDHGLLDELVMTFVPAIIGTGIPLFARRVPGLLTLVSCRTIGGAAIEARYRLPR